MNIRIKKQKVNKICIDITEDNVDYRIIANSYNVDDGKTHIGADSIDTRGFNDSALAKKRIVLDLERNHNIIVDY